MKPFEIVIATRMPAVLADLAHEYEDSAVGALDSSRADRLHDAAFQFFSKSIFEHLRLGALKLPGRLMSTVLGASPGNDVDQRQSGEMREHIFRLVDQFKPAELAEGLDLEEGERYIATCKEQFAIGPFADLLKKGIASQINPSEVFPEPLAGLVAQLFSEGAAPVFPHLEAARTYIELCQKLALITIRLDVIAPVRDAFTAELREELERMHRLVLNSDVQFVDRVFLAEKAPERELPKIAQRLMKCDLIGDQVRKEL